ncbi:MAG: hypothetical protein KME16_27210 [Scytolyngbya sp. HA4215-MV1]|nr:hypothetical protein [Scytolyngbya sp. HA4215-MV1]
MNQPISTPATQLQTTQLPTPNPAPQTIQIQLPAELFHPPAPASSLPSDISPSLMLIAFAIVVKVTMDSLKPNP